MKNKLLGLTTVLIFTFMFVPSLSSDTVDFPVTATIPPATGVSISATEVDSDTGEFGQSVDELNFDPMIFDSENEIYLPDHFFAIDAGGTGGAGAPDVNVSYTEGSAPAGQPATSTLGFKATATFFKVTGPEGEQEQVELPAHGPTKILNLITGGEQIDNLELAGGFLRVNVGIFDGNDAVIIAQGGEPFTNGDIPGTYTGTVTVTATLP